MLSCAGQHQRIPIEARLRRLEGGVVVRAQEHLEATVVVCRQFDFDVDLLRNTQQLNWTRIDIVPKVTTTERTKEKKTYVYR